MAEWEPPIESSMNSGKRPGGEEGISAEMEKIVVDSYVFTLKQFTPDSGEPLFGRRSRGNEAGGLVQVLRVRRAICLIIETGIMGGGWCRGPF